MTNLKKRLRTKYEADEAWRTSPDPLLSEAADRIEEFEVEVENLQKAIEREIRILCIPIHDPFIEDKSKPYVPAPVWKLQVANNLRTILNDIDGSK